MASTPRRLEPVLGGAPARVTRAGVLPPRTILPRTSFMSCSRVPFTGLTLALLGGLGFACGRPPQDDLEVARSAMTRAGEAQGVERAHDLCTAARSVLLRAETEVRVQDHRSALRRDYDEAARLAFQARLAGAIREELADFSEGLVDRVERHLPLLRDLLERADFFVAQGEDLPSVVAELADDHALGDQHALAEA